MDAKAVEQAHAEMNLIESVVSQVREYVPWRMGWIAKQSGLERDDVYGFVIGRGFATVTVEQARTADDALIRALAAEIMGYEVGSLQDLAWRQFDTERQRDEVDKQIEALMARSDLLHRIARNLEARIAALPETDSTGGAQP